MTKLIRSLHGYSRSRRILPDERKSVRFIIQKFNEISIFLSTSEVRAARHFHKSIAGKTYEDLSENEIEALKPHLPSLTGLTEAQEDLHHLKLTAYALNASLLELSETEFRRKIRRRDWNFKHETLVRFAWIKAQKHEILRGTSFNHPFLCQVGPVHGRKNMDREFYTMLQFPRLFFEKTGSRLLYESKAAPYSRPDFVVKDETGKRVGIEITECNRQPNSHEKDRIIEKLEAALHKTFRRAKLTVVLTGTPFAESLTANLKEAIDWINLERKRVATAFKRNNEYHVRHKEFNLNLSFHKNNSGYLFLTSEGVLYGVKPERDLAFSIRSSIDKKLAGQISDIRPCHLIIIARDGIAFTNEQLVKDLASKNLPNHKSHFDQIWAIHGKQLMQIA